MLHKVMQLSLSVIQEEETCAIQVFMYISIHIKLGHEGLLYLV